MQPLMFSRFFHAVAYISISFLFFLSNNIPLHVKATFYPCIHFWAFRLLSSFDPHEQCFCGYLCTIFVWKRVFISLCYVLRGGIAGQAICQHCFNLQRNLQTVSTSCPLDALQCLRVQAPPRLTSFVVVCRFGGAVLESGGAASVPLIYISLMATEAGVSVCYWPFMSSVTSHLLSTSNWVALLLLQSFCVFQIPVLNQMYDL